MIISKVDILSFMIQLAHQTGDLLVKYYQKNDVPYNRKNDDSIVTEADVQADRFISQQVNNQYPSETLISEELQPYFKENGAKPVWIVDPLDGTTNFCLRIRYWGVTIAHITQGEPDKAVAYFPMLDELYSAEKGKGALLNNRSIRVEEAVSDNKMSYFSCCSRTFRYYHVRIPYKIRIFGTAAYSICSVARGIARIAFEARAKIWDIAAPWLIVNEAGGTIGTINDQNPFPLLLIADYSNINYPVLAAASKAVFSKGCQQITKIP